MHSNRGWERERERERESVYVKYRMQKDGWRRDVHVVVENRWRARARAVRIHSARTFLCLHRNVASCNRVARGIDHGNDTIASVSSLYISSSRSQTHNATTHTFEGLMYFTTCSFVDQPSLSTLLSPFRSYAESEWPKQIWSLKISSKTKIFIKSIR